jgi:hypothetical protein
VLAIIVVASTATADPVHTVLNQAWQEFWRSPARVLPARKGAE